MFIASTTLVSMIRAALKFAGDPGRRVRPPERYFGVRFRTENRLLKRSNAKYICWLLRRDPNESLPLNFGQPCYLLFTGAVKIHHEILMEEDRIGAIFGSQKEGGQCINALTVIPISSGCFF